MEPMTDLLPDGETFGYNLDTRPVDGPAVLLVHGLGASTTELRPLAEAVHRDEPGWPVLAVKLSGHGTTLEDLERMTDGRRPEDVWLADCVAGFERLRRSGRPVVVAGLSMGAALGCRLLVGHSEQIAGLVLLAPVFELRSSESVLTWVLGLFRKSLPKPAWKLAYYREHGINSLPAYPIRGLRALARNGREAWRALATARAVGLPALIVAGQLDPRTPRRTLERMRQILGTDRCQLEWMPRSRHQLLYEPDCERVLELCRRFIRAAVPASGDDGGGQTQPA